MERRRDDGQAIDEAFLAWEQLRRRLYERERDWAATVTVTGDPQVLRPLQRDVARLRRDAERAFSHAIGTLEASSHD